jgi:hypothetical protein
MRTPSLPDELGVLVELLVPLSLTYSLVCFSVFARI